MYRTIAVPLDTSHFAERALVPGAELARAEDAELLLVTVSALEETAAYLQRTIETMVPRPSARLRLERDGSPAEVIARLAETPDTLVCMASHGRGWPAQLMFGSVATEVLGRVTAPLLLVGPRAGPNGTIAGGNLVVPLDGSQLADQAIPGALAFAKSFDMRLFLVTVHSPSTALATAASDTYEAVMVERVAADLQYDEVEWEVLHGHPAAAVTEFAGRLPAALISMTSHGRTGLRAALGSVATRVVHTAPCPVLLHLPHPS